MSAAAALRAWLAAPGDMAKLSALAVATAAGAVDLSAQSRLPGGAISALRQGPVPHFTGMRPHVRQAALVCGLGRELELAPSPEESREVESLPFVVVTSPREIVIELLPSASAQRFGNPFLHQWIGGLHADLVVIDCVRISHVNSVLIAWMLQIVQSAKPVPVHVRHAKPQVATQLKQLRLDHLMTIE